MCFLSSVQRVFGWWRIVKTKKRPSEVEGETQETLLRARSDRKLLPPAGLRGEDGAQTGAQQQTWSIHIIHNNDEESNCTAELQLRFSSIERK